MHKYENRDGLRQATAVMTVFETREAENGGKHISGYFAVFGSTYNLSPWESESIAPGAFRSSLANNDIRALTNHDTTLVLGRTTAGTLTLKEDDHGLWGDIIVNEQDGDAMNTWARVQRGDVSQCSFGFYIRDEQVDYRPDGGVHFTLLDVDLHEVSVCTFPAYTDTDIAARSAERAEVRRQELESWKDSIRRKLKC